MSKRRARKLAAAPATAPIATEPPRATPLLGRRTIDAAALVTALLCLALAWFSRGNLNVDGVAYLDLAGRIRSGDWAALVQGYWSPVYPVLLAVVLTFGSGSGVDAITAAHTLNAVIAVTLVWLLWRALRKRGDGALALFTFTAFLVASARTPRLDAVTPDLLLMLVLVCLGIELTREQGWRGVRVGLLGGLAFLVKTSAWPWLIVMGGVAGVAVWRSRQLRRQWQPAVALVAVSLALWGGLLSIQAGRPTMGDTGPLGACWYLMSCDGRSPDTHQGEHLAYRQWQVSEEIVVKVAVFEPVQWTYAPWSDVSAWQRGITAQRKYPIDPFNYVHYALSQLGFVLRYWLVWVAALVLIPLAVTRYGAERLITTARSPVGFVMLAGAIGVMQFVAVHAEPRLIGPYVMLGTVGYLHWRTSATPRRWEWVAALAAFTIAIGVGVEHLRDQNTITFGSNARDAAVREQRPAGEPPHRVAVIGAAFPLVPDLYRTESVVTVQLMVPDAEAVTRWPIPAQLSLLDRFRQLGITTMWFSHGKDGYRMVVLPSAAAAAASAAEAEAATQFAAP